MSDTQVPSKDRVAELRDFHAGRTGSQKGQYRLNHRDAGLLLGEIERLQRELDTAMLGLAAIAERERAGHEPESAPAAWMRSMVCGPSVKWLIANGFHSRAAQQPSARNFDMNYQPALLFAARELLGSLPTSRDWLNPDVERIFREYLSDATAQGSTQPPPADKLATSDAMNYGSGFVRVMPDGSREHVPHHDVFIELSDSAQPPAPEWQPIGTAPKDGRPFLAIGMGPMFICRWGSGANIWMDQSGQWRDPRLWQYLPEGPTLLPSAYSTATKGAG